MRGLNPLRSLTSLVPEPGPRRLYAVYVTINAVGFGMLLPAMALYAVRVVHLSSQKAGLALTIAACVGVAAGIPMGDLADRYGPKGVTMAVTSVQAVAAICYLLVGGFWTFLGVAILDILSANAALTSDAVLLRRVGGQDAAAFRASTRALINLGLALGLVGFGFGVQIGTASAYRAMFIVNAVTFAVAVALIGRLPRYEPLPRPSAGPRWIALTDKAFVSYATLNGAMSIQFAVLSVLLPLWVVYHTSAPRWSISALVVVNTVLVMLFQVRVGRGVKTMRDGGSALRVTGVLFLVSCAAMGLATGLPGWAALLLLTAAVAVHTFGELWHSSGSFALGYGLAPAHAQGQYSGVAQISFGFGQAAAPALLIGVFLSLGRLGFVVLGACFAVLGLAAPTVASWGERTRPLFIQPNQTEPFSASPSVRYMGKIENQNSTAT